MSMVGLIVLGAIADRCAGETVNRKGEGSQTGIGPGFAVSGAYHGVLGRRL